VVDPVSTFSDGTGVKTVVVQGRHPLRHPTRPALTNLERLSAKPAATRWGNASCCEFTFQRVRRVSAINNLVAESPVSSVGYAPFGTAMTHFASRSRDQY